MRAHPSTDRESPVDRHPSADRASTVAALALALTLAAAPVAPLAAQEGPGSGNASPAGTMDVLAPDQVEVSLLAGALAPVSRLSEDPETFSTELATAGLFAADAVYWARGRLGVAARLAYAPATVAVVPGGIAGAVPRDLGPADYWSFTAEVRMRFPPPGEGITFVPYLSAGAGVRLLEVKALASPEVEDSADPMAALAAGAVMPLAAPVDLRIELRDHVTFYETPAGESRTQNELAVLVGASVRVR